MKNSKNISWICKEQKDKLFKCSHVEKFNDVNFDNDKLEQIKQLELLIKNIKKNIKKNEDLLETLNNL